MNNSDTASENGDDFQPTGTAFLLGGYFILLVLLWVFMYFVEFMGGGPTILTQ